MLARIAGGSGADAERLTRRLSPALARDRTDAEPLRLAVDGLGPTAERIVELASADGRLTIVDDPELAQVAVIVARYSIAPARYARWLSRDVPHLAVVHGDRSTTIGPFVRPGLGPCLYCVDRTRTDVDPAWPAIASQLEGRSSPRESGTLVAEIAATAVRIVASHRSPDRDPLADRSLEISDSPIPVVHRMRVHPECGCRSLRGNATVLGEPSTGRRTPPTTAASDVVPA